MGLDQWIILILGPAAVFLAQSGNKVFQKWACIVGLCSQVGWFWAAFSANQPGVLVASFVYTGCWVVGVYNYWIKEKINAVRTQE